MKKKKHQLNDKDKIKMAQNKNFKKHSKHEITIDY